MRISIVGSGRVATHFAKALSKQHHIVQIYSRDLNKAQRLAQLVNAQAIDKDFILGGYSLTDAQRVAVEAQ